MSIVTRSMFLSSTKLVITHQSRDKFPFFCKFFSSFKNKREDLREQDERRYRISTIGAGAMRDKQSFSGSLPGALAPPGHVAVKLTESNLQQFPPSSAQ